MNNHDTYRANLWMRRLLATLVPLAAACRVPGMAQDCSMTSSGAFTLPKPISVPRDIISPPAILYKRKIDYTINCHHVQRGTRIALEIYVHPRMYFSSEFTQGTGVHTIGYGTRSKPNSGISLDVSFPKALDYKDIMLGVQRRFHLISMDGKKSVTLPVTYQLKVVSRAVARHVYVYLLVIFYSEEPSKKAPTSFDSHELGRMMISGVFEVARRPCKVDVGSSNMSVNLPVVSTTAFTGPGSIAGATGFNVNLNCDADVTVEMTMHTAHSDPNYTGVALPARDQGMASGVGIQLLDSKDAPVPFDKKRTIVSSCDCGLMSIPFTARYIQTTGAPVGAGRVSATVTFTMSYE